MRKIAVIMFLVLLSMRLTAQPDCNIHISSADSAVCYGEKVFLYTAFSDTLNYYWEPGGETGVIIEVTVTDTVTYILHTYNNDTSYYCTDSITLEVHPYPELEIHLFPDPVPVHATVVFSFEFVAGDTGLLANWEWIIDESVFTNVLNPEYPFHYPGSFYIRLNYQTIDSCWFFVEDYAEVNYSSVNEMAVYNFSISPNPATDQLTFSFFLKMPADAELALFNALGEMVSQVIPSTRLHGKQTVTCNVASLPPGLYFARLTIDQQSFTTKVVVKH